MRHLFHVMDGQNTYKDETGIVLDRTEKANAQATVLTTEFAQDGARYHGFQVCAVDNDGNELIRAPSRLAMMLPAERRVACSSTKTASR